MSGRVGKEAHDFVLTDASGEARCLADYRGRWLLLVFHRHLG